MSSKDNDDDYRVGYGKPPKASQYRSGQSGNREGARLHKRRTAPDMIAAQLSKKHRILVEGKPKWVPMQEIIIMQFLKLAAKGNPKALFATLDIFAMATEKAQNDEQRQSKLNYTQEDLRKLTPEQQNQLYLDTLAEINREERKKRKL